MALTIALPAIQGPEDYLVAVKFYLVVRSESKGVVKRRGLHFSIIAHWDGCWKSLVTGNGNTGNKVVL